jgi:hypothetical protein
VALLSRRGWKTWDPESVGKKYILPQGGEVTWSSFFPPSPILFFELAVAKHQSVLRLRTPPFRCRALPIYLREQSEVVRGLTGQSPDDKVLCRFQGNGWDNDTADSQRMISTVDAVVGALAASLPALRSSAESEFATFRSRSRAQPAGESGIDARGYATTRIYQKHKRKRRHEDL